MTRVGLGASITLIVIGTWLVGWRDASSEPADLPSLGMCAICLGLIGLVMCVLARIAGSDLTIGQSPQPGVGSPTSGMFHQSVNQKGPPAMSGKFEEAKGHAKEAAGDITGDDDLKREGKTDQASGKVKQKVDDAKDWVEDKVDKARDKAD